MCILLLTISARLLFPYRSNMEHGPFVWKDGNLKPSPNPWSWNRLTNVVYVEQPVGVGFTTGNVTATDEDDLSEQFIGFWKNFIKTFSMQGYKIYITGESYAGVYCSYIANAMLEKNDTTHYDVRGMMLVDALLTDYDVQSAVPAVPFVDYHRSLFHFNDTFRAQIHQLHKDCGDADYLATYLTYPPPHEQPVFSSSDECTNVFTLIANESFRINPCFNYYNIASLCPFPYNPTGISHSLFFKSTRGVYFDRADVRRAIHATHGDNNRAWQVCSDGPVFINDTDLSELPARTVLPAVVDATQNVIITHGHLDFSAAANGTLLALQNMTWGGSLGFAQAPIEPLVIPRHALAGAYAIQGLADKADLENMQPLGQLGAEAVLGVTHAERGLVYAGVDIAGHLGPADAPSVAFRLVEFLLRRAESLSDGEPFTIEIY